VIAAAAAAVVVVIVIVVNMKELQQTATFGTAHTLWKVLM